MTLFILGLPLSSVMTSQGFDIDDIVIVRDEYLEPLEHAPGFRGLRSSVTKEHLRADADMPEPVEQRGMQRKADEALGRHQCAQRSEAAIMAPLPCSLELVARSVPLVKLPLPYLPPALQTAH